MKHNCTGAREREMSLMWVCSCGEHVIFEFTSEEKQNLEYAINREIEDVSKLLEKSSVRILRNRLSEFTGLLEKVREM
jgi:hypothetical protein